MYYFTSTPLSYQKIAPRTIFSTVNATAPTARPAFPGYQFIARPFHVVFSRFRFFSGNNPTDPLIACQRRNVLPSCPCHRGRNKSLSQIRRHFMWHTNGDSLFIHIFILLLNDKHVNKAFMPLKISFKSNSIRINIPT